MTGDIFKTFMIHVYTDPYPMAEELTSDVVQEERATFDNNCNITKSDITIDEDPDVSLRGILDTAFTSTVDSQDNGVFESSEFIIP